MSFRAKRWAITGVAAFLLLPGLLIDSTAVRVAFVLTIVIIWIIIHERTRARQRALDRQTDS